MEDLGEPPDYNEVFAEAINNKRQIVGGAYIDPDYVTTFGPYGQRAFLWQNAGIRDLNDWTPQESGVHLYWASDINDNGVIAASGYNAQGQVHAYLLVPTEIMVDANRDGQMSSTDAQIHGLDVTTIERPYRFWLNDDDDGAAGDEGDHVPVSTPDYADGIIRSKRDLEDFARLHVDIRCAQRRIGVRCDQGGVRVARRDRGPKGKTVSRSLGRHGLRYR